MDEVSKKMIRKMSWRAFQESGMLWFVNRILHTFGWAICLEVDKKDMRKVLDAYPAKCRFRGFAAKSEEKGFRRVSRYMKKHAERLLKEALE